MPIPSEITSIEESRAALQLYAKTMIPNPRIGSMQRLGTDRVFLQPFEATARLLTQMQNDRCCPGPVVRAVPDRGRSYLVGRKSAAGRQVISLRLPDGDLPQEVDHALVTTTAAAGIVYSLVGRLDELIEANRGGRNRQAAQWRAEADALTAFGDELTICVFDLSEPFLASWHERVAAKGGTPPPPSVRAVQLR